MSKTYLRSSLSGIKVVLTFSSLFHFNPFNSGKLSDQPLHKLKISSSNLPKNLNPRDKIICKNSPNLNLKNSINQLLSTLRKNLVSSAMIPKNTLKPNCKELKSYHKMSCQSSPFFNSNKVKNNNLSNLLTKLNKMTKQLNKWLQITEKISTKRKETLNEG